jgi:hypothetical protein
MISKTSINDLEKFLNNLSIENNDKNIKIENETDEINELISVLKINECNKNENYIKDNQNIETNKDKEKENLIHNNFCLYNKTTLQDNQYYFNDNNNNQVCISIDNHYEKRNKYLKSIHITNKIIKFFRSKKIDYTITYIDKIIHINAILINRNVEIKLNIEINIEDTTFVYNFCRKFLNNCRYDPYNNAVRKFQGRYKGKFTEKEINSLLSYIK